MVVMLGNPLILGRVHTSEWWGLEYLRCVGAICRTTNQPSCWQFPLSLAGWFSESPELAAWLESHPQREDIYAALRPLLVERPRQERTFLDEIDQLQASLRTFQLRDTSDLEVFKAADPDISWLLPSVNHCLPDVQANTMLGLSASVLQSALERSDHGLRLVGYPRAMLQELFDPSIRQVSSSTSDKPSEPGLAADSIVVEALPEWQTLMRRAAGFRLETRTRSSKQGSRWSSCKTNLWSQWCGAGRCPAANDLRDPSYSF